MMFINPPAISKIEFVKSHPRPFLGEGKQPDLRDFSGLLVTDALCLGSFPVTAEMQGDWYIVHSKQDWILADTGLSTLDTFHRIQRFPQYRPNSNRANIIVAAYVKELFSTGPDGITLVKGIPDALLDIATGTQKKFGDARVVAFRGLA